MQSWKEQEFVQYAISKLGKETNRSQKPRSVTSLCLPQLDNNASYSHNALILRRKRLQQLHGSNSNWHLARFRAGMANL